MGTAQVNKNKKKKPFTSAETRKSGWIKQYTHRQTQTQTHSNTLTHTHTHTLTQTLLHSHTHSFTHSFTHTHTHTHSTRNSWKLKLACFKTLWAICVAAELPSELDQQQQQQGSSLQDEQLSALTTYGTHLHGRLSRLYMPCTFTVHSWCIHTPPPPVCAPFPPWQLLLACAAAGS